MHHVCTVSLMLTSTAVLMDPWQQRWSLSVILPANVLLLRSLANRFITAALFCDCCWRLGRMNIGWTVSVGAAVDSSVCASLTVETVGGWAAHSLWFWVLSSENMGQRCEISIRVSEAQPAIWIKSGAISSYTMDQNFDWTLEECLYLQNALGWTCICAWRHTAR